MVLKTTVFERHKLYGEVWAEPMTTVAQRYGLSDVGLRKICVKLEVPVPPRGHWAKLAAGQQVEKDPLPTSDIQATFTRSVRSEKIDDVVERRIAEARAGGTIAPTLTDLKYDAPSAISQLGPEAAQIAKATAKLKEKEGVLWSGPCCYLIA